MSKTKKMEKFIFDAETQAKIDNATESIVAHLYDEITYISLLELQAEAYSEFLRLQELNLYAMTCTSYSDIDRGTPIPKLTTYLIEMQILLEQLKPLGEALRDAHHIQKVN